MYDYFYSLNKRSLVTFWDLVKIMVPVMVIVKVAQDLGIIELLSPLLVPVMQLMDLPPEAGVVWLSALLVGVYGAIAALPVLAGLEMTTGQLSILCALILFAHALPVEQAIVKKAGGSIWGNSSLRVGVAIVYGIFVAWICRATGFLTEKADLASFRQFARKADGYLDWMVSSAVSLCMIFVIIVLLLVLLDVLERTGVTAWLTGKMAPMLRFSGLNEQTTPITTIGVLLGISYGGALIIQKVREGTIEPTALSLSLAWLCLSHGLIEDTGLMLALGGDFWVVLVGRVLITLLVIKILAMVLGNFSYARS